MARVLILGGTRNLGHVTALALLSAGHHVTVLNRGVTADELPSDVERLRADRRQTSDVARALGPRSFDLVLDNTTYTRADAEQAVTLFSGRVGRYVFISSGQVYLVRQDLPRPYRECDFDGPLMEAPDTGSSDYTSWLYGVDKREAEAVFNSACEERGFPVTTFRLPMVASERDHYGRIQGYIARMLDGEPILVPDEPGLPIRHVYVADVANIVASMAGSEVGQGEAFNISCGTSLMLDSFLALLGRSMNREPNVMKVPRGFLEERSLLPHASPFSGKWMSELDNSKSMRELAAVGLSYTEPEEYLPALVADYETRWRGNAVIPEGYAQRAAEIAAASDLR